MKLIKFQMLKKKNKEIVVGSNNEGKIKEIKDLLPKYYTITSPKDYGCLLYTSPSPRDRQKSRMPSSA